MSRYLIERMTLGKRAKQNVCANGQQLPQSSLPKLRRKYGTNESFVYGNVFFFFSAVVVVDVVTCDVNFFKYLHKLEFKANVACWRTQYEHGATFWEYFRYDFLRVFSIRFYRLLLHKDMEQRTLTCLVKGMITVWLTSCLTGLDSTKQVNILLIQYKQSRWIGTKQPGSHLYSDTFPYKVRDCAQFERVCLRIRITLANFAI